MFAELPDKKYSIIYADPPWDYKGQSQHAGAGKKNTGGAAIHYPTIKLKDLKGLNVLSIAEENALLFMWTSSPHLDQAIDLGKAWGFKWATIGFCWNKLKVNPSFYTMSAIELCLIFKRGKIPQPRGARDIRQYLEEKRSRHSAKPLEVRKRISQMFPQQKKVELFARSRDSLFSANRSWDYWGNEI